MIVKLMKGVFILSARAAMLRAPDNKKMLL